MGESGSPLISFPADGTSSCKVVMNSFTQHKFCAGRMSEWVKAPATKHDNLSPKTHMVEESRSTRLPTDLHTLIYNAALKRLRRFYEWSLNCSCSFEIMQSQSGPHICNCSILEAEAEV